MVVAALAGTLAVVHDEQAWALAYAVAPRDLTQAVDVAAATAVYWVAWMRVPALRQPICAGLRRCADPGVRCPGAAIAP